MKAMQVSKEHIEDAERAVEQGKIIEVLPENMDVVNVFLALKMDFEIAPTGKIIYTGIDRGDGLINVTNMLGITLNIELFNRLLILESKAVSILNK